MNTSEDEFDKWLKSAVEVPFSSELQNQILKQADALNGTLPRGGTHPNDSRVPPSRGRRKRDFRSWLAGAGGIAAAILLGVAVWNSGLNHNVMHQKSTADGVPAVNGPAQSVQTGTNAIGLKQAPLRVVGLSITNSTPSGPDNEVVATLLNTGTQPISKQDVFGVLSFHAGQGTGIGLADWITFVDAPNQVVLPGQSVQWTFQPVTAPVDSNGNLSESPSLAFYDRGTVPASQATTTWQVEPLDITVSGVTVTQTWKTGEAFQVQTAVKNISDRPIAWNNLLAIIWFGGSGQSIANSAGGFSSGASDFTQPGISRYFTKVPVSSGQGDALQPGATANLTFKLVGPVNPFLASQRPHVLVITQGGK
ncbi:hypothetical protein [Alicyclobacillus ferrooxydans]|uniref:Uncharacterized protein n=1 Tax=Alicyclobacillus ferrooxydans TaxID=471514 RepID=A0A0P9CDB5_9BACL|nr:hypothetical protein [Alicyclobacillus ferrooxydans]KPV43591.1 hypothetical protein AN477_11290 [Alicyclobacillus ferrooxydans]